MALPWLLVLETPFGASLFKGLRLLCGREAVAAAAESTEKVLFPAILGYILGKEKLCESCQMRDFVFF